MKGNSHLLFVVFTTSKFLVYDTDANAGTNPPAGDIKQDLLKHRYESTDHLFGGGDGERARAAAAATSRSSLLRAAAAAADDAAALLAAADAAFKAAADLSSRSFLALSSSATRIALLVFSRVSQS